MSRSISDCSLSVGSHSGGSHSGGSHSMELIEQSGSTLYDSTSCLDNTPVINPNYPNLSSLVSTLEVTGSVAELAVSIYNLHTVITSHSVGEADQVIEQVSSKLFAKRDKIRLDLAEVNKMLKIYDNQSSEYSELIKTLNVQKAELEKSREGVGCFLDELKK